MLSRFRRSREFYAGGLIALLGLGTVLHGRTYEIGTLFHMGPGFFPIVLGVVLVVTGMLIVLSGAAGTVADGEEMAGIDWRGCSCILLGLLSFLTLGAYAGLVPAIFACVFVSALGDRESTLRSALLLALGITVFGVILFSYILQIDFPLLNR